NEIYFEMYNDLRWYARRGGCNGDATKRTIDAWIRMMAPITPHVAEELWEAVGGKGFVSLAAFPEKIDEELDVQAEQAEEYLKGAMADINEILKVTGIKPTSIYLYTTPAWKQTVYQMGLKMARSKEISVPGLTKAAMSDPSIRTKGKEASDFARKVAEDLVKRSMQELDRMGASFDELRYLRNAAPFMTSELGCDVFVYSADDPSIKDPGRKAKAAQPGRPAIFVE
ncbi:MAG: class I tRNA ligase family protein, partial [Methanomassiliicoccales archaeon]|nr:class I tRNA ligase family protein [Methanomassiliicoccales archaeon]